MLFDFLAGGKHLCGFDEALELVPAADIVIAPASLELATATGTTITLSPFGRGGPWEGRPGSDLTVSAWAGGIYTRGTPDRPPLSTGVELGEYTAGVFVAALAAAYAGRHATLDVSMLEAAMVISGFTGLTTQLSSSPLPARRNVEIPSIVAARDGHVGFALVTAQQVHDFWVMVGRPDLAGHPDYLSMAQRWERRDEVEAIVGSYTSDRRVAEIVEEAALYRIPCVPVGNGATLPTIDHFVETGAYVEPMPGTIWPAPPFSMSATPPRREPRGEPRPHWDQRSARSDEARPLDGVRVAAFTAFWAGPFATAVLAALGAEVVTVESIQRPDGIRFQTPRSPTDDHWWEFGSVHHGCNAGKRGITLDLDDPEGLDLAEQLIARSDVVVENYAARVMEHFGLGYERVRTLNPSVIMARMPAFGLDGPWRDRTAFAMTIEQASGLAWLTGYPDADPVVPRGACDPLAGLHTATAVCAALDHRRRTGEGQLVEVSMVGAALNVAAEQVLEFAASGELLERRGNDGFRARFQGILRCRDHDPAPPTRDPDRYLALSAHTDEQLAVLRSIVGDDIEGWCRERHVDEALDALWSKGIPAARVEPMADSLTNPQLRARGYWEHHDHPIAGPLYYPGIPARRVIDGAVDTSPWFDDAAPTLGQHTHELLAELGVTVAQLEQLERRGVIGTTPRGAGKKV